MIQYPYCEIRDSTPASWNGITVCPMRSLSQVVWSEGMYLGPHEFQAQARYFEDAIQFAAAALWFQCYGLIGCTPDSDALRNKAHDLIASPAFIVMKAADEFKDKTTAPNQLWQTDFTYLKVIGWGWFYLSTVLDDFSRYIIAWKLCTTMKADDVTATLEMALDASGLDKAKFLHRPRLLSDNGSSYVSDDLAKWMERHDMAHVRGAPYHPMTQGKIERWHQTLKNRILLENYYLPGDLEAQIEAFVADYNHCRYHESIDNLTPADVYFGRGQTILLQRERIKRQTITQRRLQHQRQAA